MPELSSSNVFVLDNGAFTAKAGFSHSSQPRVMHNAIMKAKSERRRPFIGDQLDECRDASGLFFILPFQKGYLVNFDVQKSVWDYIFGKDVCNVDHSSTSHIVTEPYFNFSSIQETMSEIFFEEYQVESLLRINAGSLAVHKYHRENPKELCCLVVESGYSFTHIVPYVQGKKLRKAVMRIDIGGKLLTNHLKEIISYRQLNVMDETYVINQVKEDSCYVTQDYNTDMNNAKQKNSPTLRDYVLPDFTSLKRGYLRGQEASDGKSPNGEQLIRVNNERFAVPEILFRPSDIGVFQMGIPEGIVEVISRCPVDTQPHLYKNILLTGGSPSLPGFRQRVHSEVRALAPDKFPVRVTVGESPSNYAWHGGCSLAQTSTFPDMCVTKQKWLEEGFNPQQSKYDV